MLLAVESNDVIKCILCSDFECSANPPEEADKRIRNHLYCHPHYRLLVTRREIRRKGTITCQHSWHGPYVSNELPR